MIIGFTRNHHFCQHCGEVQEHVVAGASDGVTYAWCQRCFMVHECEKALLGIPDDAEASPEEQKNSGRKSVKRT